MIKGVGEYDQGSGYVKYPRGEYVFWGVGGWVSHVRSTPWKGPGSRNTPIRDLGPGIPSSEGTSDQGCPSPCEETHACENFTV